MNTFSSTLTLTQRPTSDQARRAALRAALVRAGNAVWEALAFTKAGADAIPSAGRDAVAEAAEVRQLARAWAQTDPRFSAELVAAADRHEVLHSAGSNQI